MRGREAVAERVAASQAKRDWNNVINRAFSGEVRFVVEKHGTPVAGIVSAEDIERLAALDARWAEGHEILKRFGRAFRDQTAEEIEETVAQGVAEVRAENRRGAEGPPQAACWEPVASPDAMRVGDPGARWGKVRALPAAAVRQRFGYRVDGC